MFALLTPEIHSYETAQMLQKPVFALPGCQRMSVNTLSCVILWCWLTELRALSQNCEQSLQIMRTNRGPKTQSKIGPKSRNTKKTPCLRELFRKVCVNFWLLPCHTSEEPSRNCSEKLVQMNFFILGGFFQVDFPPLNKHRIL